MKSITVIAKDDFHYPEYPVNNWIKGERYGAWEKEGGVLEVDSETGPFFFAGKARERLPEVFEFLDEPYPSSVLTVCKECKKPVTVQATYGDRNNPFKCDECSPRPQATESTEPAQAEGEV